MEEEKHGKCCLNVKKLASLRASRLLEIKVSVLQSKKKRHLKILSFIKSKEQQSLSFLVRPPKLQETTYCQKFKNKENLLRPLSNRKASLQTSSPIRISFSGDDWKKIRLNQTQLKCSFKKRVAEGLKKGRKKILHFWDERLERFQKLRSVQKFKAQEETKTHEEVAQILKKREETLLGEVRSLREEVDKKGRTVGFR